MAKIILNTQLVKQVVVAAEANKRVAISNTKTRGEKRGGGKKPWKQKGTGRARAGSSRSPIWAGGGITFGPRSNRNFTQKTPQKMVRAALMQMFNYFNENKQITIADSLTIKEPKTKSALDLLKKYSAEDTKVTIITAAIEPELVLASRNLKKVTVVENRNVSVLDILHTKLILMDKLSAQARGLIKEEIAEKVEKPKTVKKTAKTK